MAASTTLFSLCFPLDLQIQPLSPRSRFLTRPSHKPPLPTLKLSCSSHSSVTLLHPGRFLSDADLRRLNSLETFLYCRDLRSGFLSVRVMRSHETHLAVRLLAESFAESLLVPDAYVNVLAFLIKQYLTERGTLMPHAATLVGFYTKKTVGDEQEQEQTHFAGTVELSFNKRGANASVPSPTPPKDSPYISNMAVQKSLRRKGIGWHLLKAGEELISQMSASREVYLHCRMIDEAPFNMYTKADYKVVKTDSILVLLMLQRRKHLMCKKLPYLSMPSETDLSVSDE